MKYEDFLVTSLGKGNVISPLKQTSGQIVLSINLSTTAKGSYMMFHLKISTNAEKPVNYLSPLKRQDQEKISFLNLQKQKLELLLAEDYAPD